MPGETSDSGSSSSALDVAHRWVAAVNAGDVPGALALSAADIEISGPRGTGRGHPRLREWIERVRLHLETRRAFAREGAVVLLHEATWHDEKGFTIGQATIAHRFTVDGRRVAAVARYDRLDEALRDADLAEHDEQRMASR